MADIVCKDVQKYYGANHILKGVSFEIFVGERVGLLGKNGAGKTTLFKILNGKEPFEEGEILIPSSRQVEYLDQIPVFPRHFSVEDVLNTSFSKLHSILENMRELEEKMKENPEPVTVKQYGELQTHFEFMGGYTMETDLSRVCTGLMIDSEILCQPFHKLSGGEQTRINLGRLILMKPDILLLDEPTNHLDLKAIEWLEDYLNEFRGTVVVISHDRYFLDRVVTRIIEINSGRAIQYPGNYSYYIKEKEDRYHKQLEKYEREQRKILQLEEAAKRMHDWANRADSGSMHKRAFAVQKRIEWLHTTEKPHFERNIMSQFQEKSFSGREIIVIRNVNKSYGSNEVVRDVSLMLKKGDRVCLLGPNGCGKTTLLNLITGKIEPDHGQIKTGKSVKYAFLPQIVRFDRPEGTMLETVRYALEWSEDTARNRLAAFHFTGEEVFKPIRALSGGEKSKLKLFLLMQNEINLLILDEPTNHLDIASREWIERAVRSFGGTLLFVSHDRYFINKLATRIWSMENGIVTDYNGSYEEYRQWKQAYEDGNCAERKAQGRPAEKRKKEGNRKRKGVQKKLKQLELEIMQHEKLVEQTDRKMEEAASDYERLQVLQGEKESLEVELEALYIEWSILVEEE